MTRIFTRSRRGRPRPGRISRSFGSGQTHRIALITPTEATDTSAVVGNVSGAGGAGFLVMDTTFFTGKPNLAPFGVTQGFIEYEGGFFPPGGPYVPNETTTRAAANRLIASGYPTNLPVTMDIERWNWSTLQEPTSVVDASMANLNQIIGWYKNQAPAYTQVGYYSVGPNREYWPVINPNGMPSYAQWQASNTYLAPVIATQHILQPSIYTFYPGPTEYANWVTYANAQISEAKRIGPGKPVYPYLWMQYHEGGPAGYQYIEYDFWLLQLNTVRNAGCAGVILWGALIPNTFNAAPWDSNAEWWAATQDFIATL